MEFDVTSVSWHRRQHRNRVMLTITSVVLGVYSALSLGVYIPRSLAPALRAGAVDAGFWWGIFLVVPLLALTAVAVWATLFLTRPPPSHVVVDSEGVSFAYASGGARSLRWRDPDFLLTLTDLRATPDEHAIFYVGRPLSEQARISFEAGAAILAEARVQGLDVRRMPEAFSTRRSARVTIRPSVVPNGEKPR